MNILIIGSKGFIGSQCLTLFKANKSVAVFGADVIINYNEPNYFIIDPGNADFKTIFAKHQFDFCINCSGASSVPDSFLHPLRDYILNVYNVALLLNAIKEFNPQCKFIQLSSAAVYGNPKKLPITEDEVLLPISPYGLHKKQAEEICEMYTKQFDIKTLAIRIFSAYGTGLEKQLFWDLYQKTKTSSALVLHGTGNETRAFIHVTDIVNAISLAMETDFDDFVVMNVANEKSISIKAATEIFIEKINFRGSLKFNGLNRVGDPLYWQANIDKLKSTGYEQTVSFETGIETYCKWLREKE